MGPTSVSGFFRRCISPFSSKGQPKPAPVELTGYRSLKPESMLFKAGLKQGQVQIAEGAEGQAIARHLNRADKVYCADGAVSAGGHTLRIKDAKHDVFFLQSTPAVAAVLKSSRPAQVFSPGNPGHAHLGQVSGVQTTCSGQQFCLAGERLYRFEPQVNTWLPDADAQRLSRIGLSENGELLKVPQGTADRSRSGNTQADLINRDGVSTLRINHGQEKNLTPVDESGSPLTLTRIGLAGDVLYASNVFGELVCANVIDARDGKLRMLHHPLDTVEKNLGGGVSIEGFQHDDGGRINALVRDSRRQLHSCPLNGPAALVPEWNLSDVLVRGIEKGLPQPSLGALAGVVDLGQRGKVACDGNRLLRWDPTEQRWDPTPQQRIERLERGLDGRAYVMQDGQLKAVATQQFRPPLYAGASHELAPAPAPRTQVVLDEVLAGDKQRRIAGFAVVDGRTFVTLDQRNQLNVQLEGRDIALRFSNPQALQTLALDGAGDLYAHTKTNELLKLDRQDWQGAATQPVTWKKVQLPDGHRLESLRMGAGKQLVASWDRRHHQLNVTAAGAHEWQPLAPSQNAAVQSLAQTLQAQQPASQYKGAQLTSASNMLGQTTEGVPRSRGFFKGLKAHFHPLEGTRQIGLDIQHRIKGRQGLESLYADDQQLHRQLDGLVHSKPARLDTASRLERLSGNGQLPGLVNDLKAALGQVEENSVSAARRLGDVHGYSQGRPPAAKQPTAPADAPLHKLSAAFNSVSPSRENTTAVLLRDFAQQGMTLPAWVADRKRDRSHPSALIEGDLIHHASTLEQLGELVSELESASNDPSAQKNIGLKLHDVMHTYAQSPVHKRATQNINNYVQAEGLYNNFKLLAKDLGTEDSALHWHIARVLGLPKHASLKDAMTQEVQQLGSGQSLSSKRTKGVSVGGIVTGVAPIAPVEFFVGVTKEHANGVRISRTDAGARVEISMEDARGAVAEVGLGQTIGNGAVALGPHLRVAGEVSAAVARKKTSAISFDVKESDFPKMMSILTGEQGNVYDLLDLGADHLSGNTQKTSVDVNLVARAQARLRLNPQQDIGALDVTLRSGMGIVGGLNLAHAQSSRERTQGVSGTRDAWGADIQWLKQGAVSANIAPLNALGVASLGQDAPALLGTALPEISVSRGFDRGHSRTFNFSFDPPVPVTQESIDGVVDELSHYSPLFRRDVKALGLRQHSVTEQLGKLKGFLSQRLPLDTRQQAYREIDHRLEQLQHQHQLSKGGLRQVSAAEATVTRVGLNGDGLHAWLDDVAPANKAAIVQWFKDDPQFAEVLNKLENGKGTSVSINLEVKPAVLRAIEAHCTQGESVQQRVNDALIDPMNLRIKSMTLGFSASRSHGMSLPSLTSISLSSTAQISYSHNSVNVALEYGEDPDQPLKMHWKDAASASLLPELNIELSDQNVRRPLRPQ